MVSATLAVAMNTTSDRSRSTLKVVVTKGVILRRIKHLKECCCRITPTIHRPSTCRSRRAESTGFIVPCLLQGFYDAARLRADIGATVPRGISALVAHAAEGDTRKTFDPIERAIDSPSDVLPTPGGPHQGEDVALAALGSFLRGRFPVHGATYAAARNSTIRSLTSSRAVMINIENRLRSVKVEGVGGLLTPTAFRRCDRAKSESNRAQVTAHSSAPTGSSSLPTNAFTPSGASNSSSPRSVVIDDVVAALAEFLANGAELLPEDELALFACPYLRSRRCELSRRPATH